MAANSVLTKKDCPCGQPSLTSAYCVAGLRLGNGDVGNPPALFEVEWTLIPDLEVVTFIRPLLVLSIKPES